MAETSKLRNPADVTVQIICSGETDIEKEQVYATVMPPFVLGIPSTLASKCIARHAIAHVRQVAGKQLG